MRMQRARQIIVALLVGGFGLGGLGNSASAQEAAPAPSRDITALRPSVERSPSNEAHASPSALDPYHSLEAHVAPAPRIDSIPLPSTPPQRIHLNREQKMFWGVVGLIVHSICDAQTREFDSGVNYSRSYQTYRETRCDHCDGIAPRALRTLAEGLFSSDP